MFERYAVFYTAPPGAFADFCASWLGWDSRAGAYIPHPNIGDLDVATLTAVPRKYGFHGTLKAPFRPAQNAGEAVLRDAIAAFAKTAAPIENLPMALQLHRGFIALRPTGETPALNKLANRIVTDLDSFRAAAPPEELARRRAAGLTPRQDHNMMTWGYPYVLEDFHFHLTLTGRLDDAIGAHVMDVLRPHMEHVLPHAISVDHIALMGQASDGMFHEIHRYALTG
ncbi:DUF1045 domain-containing protein [Yoonia sp. BS5-3]|uniref:DUF1045 domain-containing protein n=1 Tax=Yoonia phaeophyticola TaxID=3137369 RepID=A0ABZ2VAN2_9RHOB